MSSGCTSYATIGVQNQMAGYAVGTAARASADYWTGYQQSVIASQASYYTPTVTTGGYARCSIDAMTGVNTWNTYTFPNAGVISTSQFANYYYWSPPANLMVDAFEPLAPICPRIEVVERPPNPNPPIGYCELVNQVFEDYEARHPDDPHLQWERASTRAKGLLIDTLDEEQAKQLELAEVFDLRVSDRLYRIRKGNTVERLDPSTKRCLSRFCIHPDYTERLPDYDVMLAQKLLLKYDEPQFLRIANETRVA